MVLVEDVYLFRTMTTGVLLIELCIFLLNLKIEKIGGAAIVGVQRLPVMIFEMGKAVGSQLCKLKSDVENTKEVIMEKLLALQGMDNGVAISIVVYLLALPQTIQPPSPHSGLCQGRC